MGGLVLAVLVLAWVWQTVASACARIKWSAQRVNALFTGAAATAYYVTLLWAVGWRTMLCGLTLPSLAPLLVELGLPRLYIVMVQHAQSRDIDMPRCTAAQDRHRTRGHYAVTQLVSILRLAAVLLSRWSRADTHGLIASCAAVVWLWAAFGPITLALAPLAAAQTFAVFAGIFVLTEPWPLLKGKRGKLVEYLQERGVVCATAGMFLVQIGVHVIGNWGHMLHYINTMCLVVWLCTRSSSCAALMADALMEVSDMAEQHLSGKCELTCWTAFTCIIGHMLHVCWSYPWLLVPFATLWVVLNSCMVCTCDGSAHSSGCVVPKVYSASTLPRAVKSHGY
jgi:hypothetical protein